MTKIKNGKEREKASVDTVTVTAHSKEKNVNGKSEPKHQHSSTKSRHRKDKPGSKTSHNKPEVTDDLTIIDDSDEEPIPLKRGRTRQSKADSRQKEQDKTEVKGKKTSRCSNSTGNKDQGKKRKLEVSLVDIM